METNQSQRAGENRSVWDAAYPNSALSPLRENIQADVCIVGAGIAGLSVAYLLSRVRKSVVVIDDGLIGSGMTGRTTAHNASCIGMARKNPGTAPVMARASMRWGG